MTDSGMSKVEAEALAETVRQAVPVSVVVTPDDSAFVVQVAGAAGTWTLYDQDDWEAWQSRIISSHVT